MDFKTIYEDRLHKVYLETVENYWTEKGYYGYLNNNSFSYDSIIGGILPIFKEKIGGFNAKVGYYYEKRMSLISDCVNENRNKLTNNPIAEIVKGSENLPLKGYLPVDTLNLIQETANRMYDLKGISLSVFQDCLHEIFDSLVVNYDKKGVKNRLIRHKIDCLMKVKPNIIYLVESKTKAKEQDDNAKGCVKRILEGWVLLVLNDLKSRKVVNWDTYRVIVPMNELSQSNLDIAFYYPSFDITTPMLGGAVSVETFYKYFFDVSYEDILSVEQKYGKTTDLLFVETLFYCINNYMKQGNIDNDFVKKLSTRYIDLV